MPEPLPSLIVNSIGNVGSVGADPARRLTVGFSSIL